MAGKPLAIYVHIPFCVSKCHFCDWVTSIPKAELLLSEGDAQRVAYIDALCTQIDRLGRHLSAQGYKPRLMYWGGGTASILGPAEITKIGDALHAALDMSEIEEATIECSPDSINMDKLRRFREVGFNRFSSGVQSLVDDRLRKLGRAHNAGQAETAVNLAREAGFDNISIDLICGFPDETMDEVETTVTRAMKLPVSHVSFYPFRPTPGTVMRHKLGRGQVHVDLSRQKGAYVLGKQIIESAGLAEYSGAHFGRRFIYDMSTFQLRMDWIGFGSGAHSLLGGQLLSTRKGMLARYNSQPTKWTEATPASSPIVSLLFLYQALMTYEGIERRTWLERIRMPLEDSIRLPPLQAMLDFFRARTRVIEDEAGMRLPREDIANLIFDYLYSFSPEEGRAGEPDQQVAAQ